MQKRKRSRSPSSRASPALESGFSGRVVSVEGDIDSRKKVLKYLSYFENQIDAILNRLLNHMAPDNPNQSKVLLKSLSRVTESGVAPSFEDSSARTGYTQRRFKHRAAQVIRYDKFVSETGLLCLTDCTQKHRSNRADRHNALTSRSGGFLSLPTAPAQRRRGRPAAAAADHLHRLWSRKRRCVYLRYCARLLGHPAYVSSGCRTPSQIRSNRSSCQ
jgi:hypothetical protein